jgi:Na+-translocating ferredoxin:NAD+ oxidoreductase RnfE subunit
VDKFWVKNIFNYLTQRDGLILVLGIVPLAAGASNMATGIAIGAFFLAALIINSVLINIMRLLIPVELRIVIIVLVVAITISVLHILMQVWFYDASEALGIYIPLVAMNSLLLAMVNDQAMSDKFISVIVNALTTGFSILILCTFIGVIRQFIELPVIQSAAGVFFILAMFMCALKLICKKDLTVTESIDTRTQ